MVQEILAIIIFGIAVIYAGFKLLTLILPLNNKNAQSCNGLSCRYGGNKIISTRGEKEIPEKRAK